MPNHITNQLQIDTETDQELEDIKKFIHGDGTEKDKEDGSEILIDFNKIIKMPDHIKATTEPNSGKDDWWQWSIDNWGTKWNAYAQEDAHDEINFQTAWNTPVPVIKALSLLFPNAEFSVRYADEDMGFNCGGYGFKNGEELPEYTFTPREGREADEFACDLLGYPFEDFMEDYEVEYDADGNRI